MNEPASELETRAVLAEVRQVTDEISALSTATSDLRTYRIELCRRARKLGVTTRVLGQAAGVSGVAVTLWLQQPEAKSA
jgi:hypothetical protein